MIVPNWDPCWTTSGSHDQVDVDDHGPAQITSSLIKAIFIPAVGACCAGGRSNTPFQSGATNARNGQLDRDVHWSLTRRSTPGATWSSAVSIGSNSGAGWPLGTRNARSIIGPWLSWLASSSGSTHDSTHDSPDRP